MKPASFDYYSPGSLQEALQVLDQHRDSARPLAGGQSLVPMMNFRLIRPAILVDMNGLRELDFLKIVNDELHIGAMTRQRALERSAAVATGWPLLHEATRHIGHIHNRNRGTVGGSLAHAYPSAELPLVMIALDASFLLRSAQGERIVLASDFFVDAMTTVLQPGELLVEIRVPRPAARTGWAFEEVSRRHGDFALVAVAGVLGATDDRQIDKLRLVFTGAKPHLFSNTEALKHQKLSNVLFAELAESAVLELEPQSDIHATAEYRREVSRALARRVLKTAAARM
jgi:carbon-monoxide dehydrogenase medium subunit/2-furoyl-CoA dehydrogenase FAD binding subunit